MNKQTFLEEIEKLTKDFTSQQQELVEKMIDAFSPYEHGFENGEFYAKKIKDNNADNPVHSFSIGVKNRPLTFVRFTLNLHTNEIKKIHSTIAERTVNTPSLHAPDGSVIHYGSQTFVYSKQEIETL